MGKCISKKSVQLDKLDPKNIKRMIPSIKHSAYVVKVYDGDTVTIIYENESDNCVYKSSVRIRGIDAPEMRTKNKIEKEIALKAKEEMSNLVYKKYVKLENIDYDKYGRILADIYIKNINVSEYLIKKRLAVKYGGGTKQIPKDWKIFYETGVM